MKNYLFVCLAVFLGTANAATTTNFTGGYDVSNWTKTLNGGKINTNKAPSKVILRSSNNGSGATSTNFTIAAIASETITFDWRYTTKDSNSSFDPFGWILNGVFTQVTSDSASGVQKGSVSFAVIAGDVFGFSSLSTDSLFGRGRTVVKNFSASPSAVPVPSALLLMGSGLIGVAAAARRKTKKA